MRISRIRIENFRNFRDFEIDSFPRSGVLVGENGIGKSNLLHALRLVLDPDLPDSARRLRAEDICEHSAATFADGVAVRIEVDLTDIAGDPARENTFDGCYTSLDPLTARLAYTFQPRSDAKDRGRPLTRDDYDFEVVGGPDSDRDARRIRRDVSLTVLPALRDAADALSRWRGSPLQELLEASPPSTDALATAAAGITSAMDTLSKDKQIQGVSGNLKARLERMAGPQMDVDPTLGFASSIPERLLRSIRLYVDPSRTRSVSETSTGNANVIFLGLLLERLATRRATDVVVDTFLAVEEPEAHLHPVLQRQLFRYLLNSETSLVVTTHSPHIAAVTPLDALVLLRSESVGGTTAATVSDTELTSSQQADLERYLDVSRAEILFCTAAIFVEGASELYLLPALARALDFDLDAHGVIVTSVGGTDFAPYHRLTSPKALDIPHAIITDGDPIAQGKQVHAGLARALQLLPDEVDWVPPIEIVDAETFNEEPPEPENEDKDQDGAVADDAAPVRLPDAELAEKIRTARHQAARQGIFVGENTLEIDIAPLLADQMIAAHTELGPSPKLQAQFDKAVHAIATGGLEDKDSKELLRRVRYISKGRFAQRLAAHVEIDGGVLDTVRTGVTPIVEAGEGELSQEQLIDLGTYGYLVAALDYIARQVTGCSLFPRPATRGDEAPTT